MHPFFTLVASAVQREQRDAEQQDAIRRERSAAEQQIADARADLASRLVVRLASAPTVQELALTQVELARLGDVVASALEAIYRERLAVRVVALTARSDWGVAPSLGDTGSRG